MTQRLTMLISCLISLSYLALASANKLEKMEEKMNRLEGKQAGMEQVIHETGEVLAKYQQDSQYKGDEREYFIQGGQEMEFVTTPQIILPQITESLVVSCSVDLHKLESMKKTDDVIREVSTISVMRDGQDIASYRKGKPALSFEEDPNVVVKGNFTDKFGYLSITYSKPTGERAGAYLCLVGGFDHHNYPVLRRQTLEIIDVDYVQMMTDINNLQNNINLNNRTISDQQQEIEQINKKSEEQTKEIESLNKILQHQNLQISLLQNNSQTIEDLRKTVKDSNSKIETLEKRVTTSNELLKNLQKSDITNKIIQNQMNVSIYELEQENKILNQSLWSFERENMASRLPLDSGRDVSNVRPDVFFSVGHRGDVWIVNGRNVIFDQIITNEGGAYNKTSGIFLCPVSGYYHFEVNLLGKDKKHSHFQLLHNREKVLLITVSGEGRTPVSNSVYILLEKGDTVSIAAIIRSYIYGGYSADTPPPSVFNGRLIAVR